MAAMQRWRCSTGRGALLLSMLVAGGRAAVDLRKRSGVVAIEKALVTEVTVYNGEGLDGILRRADITICPVSHTACPADRGGCCVQGYACGTDNWCYSTTREPQTCAGKAGQWACPADVGAGCCPYGHACGRGDLCIAPSTLSSTVLASCPFNYFACPTTLGGGCCLHGMACAASQCWSTQPQTYTLTQTVTSTDAAAAVVATTTITSTTIVTPTQPAGPPTDPVQGVMKYFPSYVAKVDAVVSHTPDSGGGGLGTAQIAGIVAGAAGFLIIVLLAAFIIIRHLNKVVRAVESTQNSSNGAGGGTGGAGAQMRLRPPMRKFTGSQIEAMSVDDLNMSSSRMSLSQHHRQDSDPDLAWLGAGPEFDSPKRGTPGSGSYSGYTAVPGRSSSGDRAGASSVSERHDSLDGSYSEKGGQGGAGLRFSQLPSPGTTAGARMSILESQASPKTYSLPFGYSHGRNYSNASDASSELGGSSANTPGAGATAQTPLISELEATSHYFAELPAACPPVAIPPSSTSPGGMTVTSPSTITASPTAIESPLSMRTGRSNSNVSAMSRPPPVRTRRQSSGHQSQRSDTSTTSGGVSSPLAVVSESAEFHTHGHYGPADRSVGQTAAGLSRADSSESR